MNANPESNPYQITPGCSDLYWASQDGIQIVAREWAIPDPAGGVLILHGIGDHSGRFVRMAEHLNASQFSVLAPDMRGHGRSDGRRGYVRDFDTLLDDIDQALLRLANRVGNAPLFVYGQSMGGLLAMLFVMRRRPDILGLIASSPALGIAMQPPAWKVVAGKILRRLMPRFSLDSGLNPEDLSDDPQVVSRARSDRYRHRRITPGVYFGMIESGNWCLANAATLTCPTLLLHGKQDQITDHRASIEFAEKAATCELHLIDDGKHELHNMLAGQAALDAATDFQNRCILANSRKTGPASPVVDPP